MMPWLIIGAIIAFTVGVWNLSTVFAERRHFKELKQQWRKGWHHGYDEGRDLGEMLGAARGYRLRCNHHLQLMRGGQLTSEDVP